MWCWRELLSVPWTARRSNQSIIKEISPECSLEGQMLKLKLQYFGHLMQRTNSFENSLMLGKIEGRWRRGQQKIRWLNGITDSMDISLNKLGVGDGQGGLVCCGSWGHRVGHDWTTELNWFLDSDVQMSRTCLPLNLVFLGFGFIFMQSIFMKLPKWS